MNIMCAAAAPANIRRHMYAVNFFLGHLIPHKHFKLLIHCRTYSLHLMYLPVLNRSMLAREAVSKQHMASANTMCIKRLRAASAAGIPACYCTSCHHPNAHMHSHAACAAKLLLQP